MPGDHLLDLDWPTCGINHKPCHSYLGRCDRCEEKDQRASSAMSLVAYMGKNKHMTIESAIKAYGRDVMYDMDEQDLNLLSSMGLKRIWLELVNEYYQEIGGKGYAIAGFGNTGILEIKCVAANGKYSSDEEAVRAAVKDGVKLIPVEELPTDFGQRRLGWIDTPANRKRIWNFCNPASEN